MSASIKKGSVRTVCNQDKQQSSLIYNEGTGKLYHLSVDNATNALAIIDYAHHEIHAGKSFCMSQTTNDLGGETGDLIQIYWTTADSAEMMHMLFTAKASGEVLFEFREAPTGGATGGSPITPINHRRDSNNVSNVQSAFGGGTIATGGTLLHSEYMGATGFFSSQAGDDSRGRNEFILAPNTKYAIYITDTSAINATLTLDWYEHTDKS